MMPFSYDLLLTFLFPSPCNGPNEQRFSASAYASDGGGWGGRLRGGTSLPFSRRLSDKLRYSQTKTALPTHYQVFAASQEGLYISKLPPALNNSGSTVTLSLKRENKYICSKYCCLWQLGLISRRFLKGFTANEQAEDSAKGCIYHFSVGGKSPVSALPHRRSPAGEHAMSIKDISTHSIYTSLQAPNVRCASPHCSSINLVRGGSQ